MRVLFACSASRDYIRNRTLVRALRRHNEVEVVASAARSYPRRLAVVLPRVLTARRRFDVCFAGFLGQPLVPVLRMRGLRPVILDAFISIYDTLCLDRRAFSPRSPVGRASRWLDTLALRWASLVLTDTAAAAEFMAQEFGIPLAKFVAVPVGADESLFYPRPGPNGPGIDVLYVCTYLPLHGVPVVVEAANLLRDREGIQLTIVGKGPERARAESLARHYGLTNCRFVDWLPLEQLPERTAACHIYLGGHFSSDNAKARRVVPGKVYQGLAMARPVIIGECAASAEWFRHGESAYMVPMGDARALSVAIAELSASPELRDRIGRGGRSLYEQQFSEAAIASLLDQCIGRLARAE
ncbi:MAG: glycosyltransferase [Dehalococcoidia bacterium]|nr:glycosyltransferase [Dehalococcoidia bacterium]